MNDTMKSCYQQLNTFVDHYLDTLRLVLEEKNDLELTEHAIAAVSDALLDVFLFGIRSFASSAVRILL